MPHRSSSRSVQVAHDAQQKGGPVGGDGLSARRRHPYPATSTCRKNTPINKNRSKKQTNSLIVRLYNFRLVNVDPAIRNGHVAPASFLFRSMHRPSSPLRSVRSSASPLSSLGLTRHGDDLLRERYNKWILNNCYNKYWILNNWICSISFLSQLGIRTPLPNFQTWRDQGCWTHELSPNDAKLVSSGRWPPCQCNSTQDSCLSKWPVHANG